MKKTAFFLFLSLVLTQTSSRAALREEWIDEKGDGKKNAHIFYDGKTPVKTEVDKNGDGKPDLFIQFKNGKRWTARESTRGNGIIDRWYYYNDQGQLLQKVSDTNGDGKPDLFFTQVNGSRERVIKEYDRNFDGKIDKRVYQEWDAKKSIMVPNQNRMTKIPNPGYTTITKEEDNNYDGVIDAYKNRADKTKTLVGQNIDPRPMRLEDAQPQKRAAADAAGSKKSQTEALVDRMNQRYGVQS